MQKNKTATIILGGGCFWCTQAIFQNLKGVKSVTAGYAGGEWQRPDYASVATGTTGHAEVIKINYNPNQISTKDLLKIFFYAHDPTQKDGQGADLGPQYRSIILYTTNDQKNIALSLLKPDFVTQIKPLIKFSKAEAVHQNYYQNNLTKPYCQLVISPKLLKLKKKYAKFTV